MGSSLGFILILLANTFVAILLAMGCFVLINALLRPTVLAHLSKNTSENQGKTMGIAESYMSLGRIIGPIWGGMIFDVNIYYPFISGVLIFLVMYIITIGKVNNKANPGVCNM